MTYPVRGLSEDATVPGGLVDWIPERRGQTTPSECGSGGDVKALATMGLVR